MYEFDDLSLQDLVDTMRDLEDEMDECDVDDYHAEAFEEATAIAATMQDERAMDIVVELAFAADENITMQGRRGRRGDNIARRAIMETGRIRYDNDQKGGDKTIPIAKYNTTRMLESSDLAVEILNESVTRTLDAHTKLSKRVKDMVALRLVPPGTQIKYGSELTPFAVRGRAPSSISEITSLVNKTVRTYTAVGSVWQRQVMIMLKKAHREVPSFDEHEPSVLLNKFNNIVAALRVDLFIRDTKLQPYADKKYTRRLALATEELPGNSRLVLLRHGVTPDDVSPHPVPLSQFYRGLRIRHVRTIPKRHRTTSSVTMNVMSPDEMLGLLDISKQLIDILVAMQNEGMFVNNLKKAAEIQERVDRIVFRRILNHRMGREFNAVYLYTAAFARWASQPTVVMISRILSQIKAINAMVISNMDRYRRPSSS